MRPRQPKTRPPKASKNRSQQAVGYHALQPSRELLWTEASVAQSERGEEGGGGKKNESQEFRPSFQTVVMESKRALLGARDLAFNQAGHVSE